MTSGRTKPRRERRKSGAYAPKEFSLPRDLWEQIDALPQGQASPLAALGLRVLLAMTHGARERLAALVADDPQEAARLIELAMQLNEED